MVVGGCVLDDILAPLPHPQSLLLPIHRYRWLCYINPNYYGFSASAVLLLSDFESDCERNDGSEFECYAYSGQYVLDSFAFHGISPYQNIVVSYIPLSNYSTVQN